jgi:hypothetical protein
MKLVYNITDTNTEPTIALETEPMVVELSCVNEAGIAGSDIPPVFVFCCWFFFLFSVHFIQKPCYIITLFSPGELHRGPRGLHNSFDQGKYQIE